MYRLNWDHRIKINIRKIEVEILYENSNPILICSSNLLRQSNCWLLLYGSQQSIGPDTKQTLQLVTGVDTHAAQPDPCGIDIGCWPFPFQTH